MRKTDLQTIPQAARWTRRSGSCSRWPSTRRSSSTPDEQSGVRDGQGPLQPHGRSGIGRVPVRDHHQVRQHRGPLPLPHRGGPGPRSRTAPTASARTAARHIGLPRLRARCPTPASASSARRRRRRERSDAQPTLQALALGRRSSWLVDFLTKRLVLATRRRPARRRVEVLGDFVRFIYVRNPGSAMGLFPVGRWALVGDQPLAPPSSWSILYRHDRPRRWRPPGGHGRHPRRRRSATSSTGLLRRPGGRLHRHRASAPTVSTPSTWRTWASPAAARCCSSACWPTRSANVGAVLASPAMRPSTPTMSDRVSLRVADAEAGERLDRFLAGRCPDLSPQPHPEGLSRRARSPSTAGRGPRASASMPAARSCS